MHRPTFWLVGGPNGAGKSTLVGSPAFREHLKGVQFLNPDAITLNSLKAAGYEGYSTTPDEVLRALFIASANQVMDTVREYVERKESVGVETVLSTDKYMEVVRSTKSQGGFFGLIYVAVESPDISCQRVARRVSQGGHGITADKIHTRWKRSLEILPRFLSKADAYWVYDNSNSDSAVPPKLVAMGTAGKHNCYCAPFNELRVALEEVHP